MNYKHLRRNHLYQLRRNRGLRQKHLALLLGYRTTTMISRFESGETHPPLAAALALQLALGARLEEIFIDLHRHILAHVIKRATHLPNHHTRAIRSRLLGKD